MITVAAHRNDPRGRAVQTFSNSTAQHHWVRETHPDREQLSPLAKFLAAHLTSTVGTRPHPAQVQAVCFSAETKIEYFTRVTKPQRVNGIERPFDPIRYREMWGDEDAHSPLQVNWLFEQIKHHDSDTTYWNRQAERILAAGTVRITVGTAEWRRS